MKKKQKMIAVLAALGIAALCGMSLYASGPYGFEKCYRQIAEDGGGGINYGAMCVTRYNGGSCRYNDCSDCNRWHMCTPVEIKYCPK